MDITLAQTVIGRILPLESRAVSATDTLIQEKEGVLIWKRAFRSRFPGSYPVSELAMELEVGFPADFRMIPAVSYNGNPFGSALEPQGFEKDGLPWSYASSRTAVPGCSFAQNAQWHIGLFADNRGLPCGLSASIAVDGEKTVLKILLPEQEMPYVYASRGQFAPGYRDTAILSSDTPLTVTAYIVYGKREEGLPGYARLLDAAWRLFSHPVHPWFGERELWNLAATYAVDSLLEENEDCTFFNIGLRYENGAFRRRVTNPYETCWCGQNIGFANGLMADYLLTGKEAHREIALKVLDSWMKAVLPSGLMYMRFKPSFLNNPEEADAAIIDSCNLGATIENLIEASELAQKCGAPRPEYREAALGVCEFMMKTQQANGNYPAAFNNKGEVVQPEGATGGFVTSGMLWGYAATKDTRYLTSAQKAFDFYFGELSGKGYTTAGALDTYCIDKEAAIPILASALMLYQITKDASYLRKAEHTAYYLSTWQWHHTVSFPKGTAMGDMDYDTLGGTAVSTQHHHIDAYALRYVSYLLRLAELTGNPLWKERGMAAWNNASIGVSDGKYRESGLTYPAGGQSEAFCHTRWGMAYNTSRWLVAWMGSFRMEVLRKTDFFRRSGMEDGWRV